MAIAISMAARGRLRRSSNLVARAVRPPVANAAFVSATLSIYDRDGVSSVA
jgi:hypothetical protein